MNGPGVGTRTGEQTMARLEVVQIPCLEDNYAYLVHDAGTGTTAAIDSPDPRVILAALDARGWTLDYVLNTHHHWDHAGGNLVLKGRTDCRIVGHGADAERLPGLDIRLKPGDSFAVGTRLARVLDTPGHTRAHICWWFPEDQLVFVGDTLFALGCGRLFEGTPEQMWTSLQRLAVLPDDTRVYCAHEYTQNNGRFALTVEPDNDDLVRRMAEVDQRRAAGAPTIPTTIGQEKTTNPFLRPSSPGIRATLGLPDAPDVAVFAETRRRKDSF